MTTLTVLKYPDPRLKIKASPVTVFDAKLKALIDNMLETMYTEDGIGLAATQVNVHQQIIVMDLSADRNKPQHFINPVVIGSSGKHVSEEGCLSIPEFRADVQRAKKLQLKARDINGDHFEIEADGILSICLQHEIDHLNGIVFVDRLSRIKQERYRKKLTKLKLAAS